MGLSPLLGCAVADALGKPFETKPSTHGAFYDWDGESYLPGDYPNLPKPYQDTGELLNRPGVPTDDTQMSRILGRSLVNGTSAREGYVEWLNGSSFVGAPRGMGGTIRRSLEAHSKGETPMDCDPRGKCGTGAAMRSGVIGMLDAPLDIILNVARADAAITHPGHPEAEVTASAMALAVMYTKNFALLDFRGEHKYKWDLTGFLSDWIGRKWPYSATTWALRLVDEIVRTNKTSHICDAGKLTGSVVLFPDEGVGITASAILCAAVASTYKGGVLKAIRLGGDTDTRAAMTGTVLGTKYGTEGVRGIPGEWVSGLYESKDIMDEDRALAYPNIRPRG